jgi:tetratricopeptide (TPR) repeat protein
VLLDQGNLSAARASYQAAHDIVEDLARSEPDKTLWQDDLAMANERLGIVQMAQGDLSAALSSYQQRLDIAERLAKSDPGKGSWQRELSQAYSRIGDVQMAQGNLPAALSSYQACLAVITPLARSDPGNTGWQRDLAIAYAMLGNAQRAQGDLPAALGSYQSSIDIDRRLADANPGNADWQNDMSITYNRIGDVRLAQDDLPAALASYQASLAIIEPLAKSDRSNVGWQRDLVASYLRVGNVLFRLGRPQEAVDRFGAAIETGKAVDPSAIYLRRAVAEIVMSDFAASAKDAATALQLKPTEPYSALWLHVARVLAGQNDADELAANAGKIDRGKWPGPVFALFLGSMDPDAIRKLAASAEPQGARLGQLCEADYFIGIYQIEKSQPAAARASFQSASDRCPHGFYEYTAAKFELTRLDNPAGAQTKQ